MLGSRQLTAAGLRSGVAVLAVVFHRVLDHVGQHAGDMLVGRFVEHLPVAAELLLEGAVLHLKADLEWLELIERGLAAEEVAT